MSGNRTTRSSSLLHPASQPLQRTESVLIAHADRQNEKNTRGKGSGAHMVALTGAHGKDGTPLAFLPAGVCDIVASHLDLRAKAALTELWVNRLQPPARQSVLNRAADVYGFSEISKANGQARLEKLASGKYSRPALHWPLPALLRTLGDKQQESDSLPSRKDLLRVDAVLAGLAIGKLTPESAVRRSPDNRTVVMHAVEQSSGALDWASAALRGDRELVMLAVEKNDKALTQSTAVAKYRGDREIVMHALKHHPMALEHASDALKDDREVVMCAVKLDGMALEHASIALKDDREVVMCAIKQNGRSLEHAGRTLKRDGEVVMRAIDQDGMALEHAHSELRSDRTMVLHAVKRHVKFHPCEGGALQFASAALRADREVVMSAVQWTCTALRHASATLQDDYEIVLCAIEQKAWALKYASHWLRDDREVVTFAVSKVGEVLQYASWALRNDWEVVACAVDQDGSALQYASFALQNDMEIVMRAIEQKPWAFEYAGRAVQDEIESHRRRNNCFTTSLSALLIED